MPKGVNVEVDDGFAVIDFEDGSLRGPALAALRKNGAPIEVRTRSGPRRRYVVPEGNARSAGLIDGSSGELVSGDTGAAQALVDADPNVNPGDDESDWHHPVLTSEAVYVGATTAEENMAMPSVSTTVEGSVPTAPPVAPLHAEVIASVKEATSVPEAVAADETPDDSWTVADLKSYAEARGIDLGGATKKADILDLLRKP